ncbi:MAG: TetR/AcrR family transcriptional regulator [Desulfosalsimonadaceae bacterium]
MNLHSVNEDSFFLKKTKRCVIKDPEKPIRSNNDKYHQILNAAIKVFAEQGYHKATISQVAKAAGVADGTIYIYFKNKADILFNFFSYKTRRVFDRFKGDVDAATHAEDKLRSLIRRHLCEFQQDPNMAVVFQREALQARYIDEVYIKDITKMYLDILEDIIVQGQQEGSIRKDFQPGLAKRFILGAVNEVINTWVVTGIKYDLVAMADPLVDLYFKGIGINTVKIQ